MDLKDPNLSAQHYILLILLTVFHETTQNLTYQNTTLERQRKWKIGDTRGSNKTDVRCFATQGDFFAF